MQEEWWSCNCAISAVAVVILPFGIYIHADVHVHLRIHVPRLHVTVERKISSGGGGDYKREIGLAWPNLLYTCSQVHEFELH